MISSDNKIYTIEHCIRVSLAITLSLEATDQAQLKPYLYYNTWITMVGNPGEWKDYPISQKIRVELIAKMYSAARIASLTFAGATRTNHNGLHGPDRHFNKF